MSRWAAAGILALVVLPYFLGLGQPDLWDPNETAYAEPPREAVESGDWLVPAMNYEPWFDKPPGVTWVTIPFYLVLGSNELGARLPMALAAAATILLTFLIGRRLGGFRAGLLAAGILATTAKFFMFSRQLAADVYLTTAYTAAAWGYLRWLGSEGERRSGLHVAGVALGLGVLMKGPVALILPAIVVPLHLTLSGRIAMLRRLRPLVPAAIALAIAVPWFVLMIHRYGNDFLEYYVLRNHVARVLSSNLGSRGPLFYPYAFLADALPWSVALPGALVLAIREGRGGAWRRDPRLAPVLWSAVVVVFFTLSLGKRSVYLLPIYPAVALVVGLTLDRLAAAAEGWRGARWMLAPLLLAGCVAVVAGAILLPLFPYFRTEISVAVGLLGAWVLALGVAWRRRAVLGASAAAIAILGLLGAWVAVQLEVLDTKRPARAFAERIAREAGPDDGAGRFGVGLSSLTYYAKRPFFSLHDRDALRRVCRKAPQTWVVLPEAELAALTGDLGLTTERIDEGVYLQVSLPAVLGRRPLERTLLLVRVTPLPRPLRTEDARTLPADPVGR